MKLKTDKEVTKILMIVAAIAFGIISVYEFGYALGEALYYIIH